MGNIKIRHKGIEITKDKPFENCRLKRTEDAERINKIIENSEGGFTLAINGEWGVGKTTFLKMWEADLKSKEYTTIYLNAWEHDISSEPLICILGELCKLLDKKNLDIKKRLMSNAKYFSKKTLPIVFNGLTSHFLGNEGGDKIKDFIEAVTNGSRDNYFDQEISDYESRTDNITELKKTLEEAVEKVCNGKRLIFIVDELDRCRPDFAVEILEKIKHLFSVKNVVFVLSIDKIQLGYSIQGHYGSDKINAQEYLRRFIDIEYNLNVPHIEDFVDYLYDYYNFDSFIKSNDRKNLSAFSEDKDNLLQIAHTLVKGKQLTLRKVDKMFAYMRLALLTYQSNQYLISDVLLLVVYLKLYDDDVYQNIKTKKYSLDELSNKLDDLLEGPLANGDNTSEAGYSWTLFLNLYNKGLLSIKKFVNLMDEIKQDKISIKSKYISNEELIRLIQDSFNASTTVRGLNLDFIIRHVEMTSGM